MKTNRLALTATISTCLAATIFAQAPVYKLTKYLDTGTQVPGADPGVLFTSFDYEGPSLQNGVLCFEGRFADPGTGATEGIFTVDAGGAVTPIVFDTDPSPSGGTFGDVRDEMFIGSQIVWRVSGWSTQIGGIYARLADGSGPITALVDTTTIIPGTMETFGYFDEFGMDGDLIFFKAENGAGDRDAYIKNLKTDTISIYANRSTTSPFPGAAATLTSFYEPMVRDGRFTIKSWDTNNTTGLLTDFGAGIVGPVNSTVATPHGLGNFSNFDESSIDGDLVVWQGETSLDDNRGIYMYDHSTGTFTAIADETIARPDGGFFDGFNGNPSISIANGVTTVIFETGDTVNDLWAWIDGSLVPIVRQGDILDGKEVVDNSHDFPYSAEGTTTALVAIFTDGTKALYLAEAEADCNGNGIPDVDDIAGGAPDENENGVPDSCECVTANYCTTSPNTAGPGCTIGWQGSLELSSNNFTVTATGAPPLKFGVFFYGANQAEIPLGEGSLCVGGQKQRLQPPVMMDQQGDTNLLIDFTAPPVSSGPFPVTPFSTWNFQFWCRDPLGGPAGFNFSDGLEVTFCP